MQQTPSKPTRAIVVAPTSWRIGPLARGRRRTLSRVNGEASTTSRTASPPPTARRGPRLPMPVDGLEVGSDQAGLVGRMGQQPIPRHIESVRIDLD